MLDEISTAVEKELGPSTVCSEAADASGLSKKHRLGLLVIQIEELHVVGSEFIRNEFHEGIDVI